jgi:hypothetical protein
MKPFVLALGALSLLALTLLSGRTPVQATGEVTDCSNDSDLVAKVGAGGSVTFNCGTATIVLSGAIVVTTDTTIDGGGTITLSGGNANRLFFVNDGATLTLKNFVLTNGYSPNGDGGAIYNGGHLMLDGVTIQNSQTPSNKSGGAIVTYGPMEITSSTLVNNKAGNGGAIYPRFSPAHVTITDSVLDGNQTTGAVGVGAGLGGAILLWDGATVDISGGDISYNTAQKGGAIYNQFANVSMSLSRTRVTNNTTTSDGGGIYNGGTMTLTNVVVSGNSVGFSTGYGGGIDNLGTATLTNVTLFGNDGDYGGGIYNGGTMTLTNSTLTNNSAGHIGGGIYNVGGTATLTNVTMSANSAAIGGGIENNGSDGTHLFLTNVIVAGGSSGVNCALGKPPDVSLFNLSTDSLCNFGSGRDNVLVMLGPLTENGGFTPTQMPLAGSPAIDGGTGTGCPTKDQRGFPRPVGVACDVGAVEYGSFLPHKQGDLNCDGLVNEVDALLPERFSAGLLASPLGGCPPLGFGLPQFGDVRCDGSVDGGDTLALLQFIVELAINPPQLVGCTPIGETPP